ncbi:MAG: dTMP kinase [Leptospiraceae bacterium]|nr:dTMP kinase [Leptospiraceae bacterium]
MEKKENLFIVLEGIDGSGKSSLSKNLVNALEEKSFKTKRFFEPTDYETGKYIRKFLKGEISLSKEKQIEAFIKDREDSVSKNILPSLQNRITVILDRYYYSTAAYQAGEEYSPERIIELNEIRKFPKPDLLFFLKIEPERALERIQSRSGEKERFDSLENLKTIHENFLAILPPNTIHLNAELSEEELVIEVIAHILKILKH